MAYIRKRGSKWSFTITSINPATGKREQYTKSGFETKKDAELAAMKFEPESRRKG